MNYDNDRKYRPRGAPKGDRTCALREKLVNDILSRMDGAGAKPETPVAEVAASVPPSVRIHRVGRPRKKRIKPTRKKPVNYTENL